MNAAAAGTTGISTDVAATPAGDDHDTRAEAVT